MQTDNGSIFSHINGLLFARYGRRKSDMPFPEEGGKKDDSEACSSVSLVRMAKLKSVKESENVCGRLPTATPSPKTNPRGVDQPRADPPPVSYNHRTVSGEAVLHTDSRHKLPSLTAGMSGLTRSAAPPPLPPRRAGELPPLPRATLPAVPGEPAPPPLPKRKSSLHVQPASSELEGRFRFHSESDFPLPEPFSDGKKTYPSLLQKSVVNRGTSRDKAPPPPPPSQPPPPPPPR